jgi:hypothetical protein
MDAYKLARGCCDCGYNLYAEALDFDHVDPASKQFTPASLVAKAPAVMWAEIHKCVVRCANCHRHRTQEAGHYFNGVSRHRDPTSNQLSFFDLEVT